MASNEAFPDELALALQTVFERLDGLPVLLTPTVLQVRDAYSGASERATSLWTIEAELEGHGSLRGMISFELAAKDAHKLLEAHQPILVATGVGHLKPVGLVVTGHLTTPERGEDFHHQLAILKKEFSRPRLESDLQLSRTVH